MTTQLMESVYTDDIGNGPGGRDDTMHILYVCVYNLVLRMVLSVHYLSSLFSLPLQANANQRSGRAGRTGAG